MQPRILFIEVNVSNPPRTFVTKGAFRGAVLGGGNLRREALLFGVLQSAAESIL
jgi:hypothetical protein